MKPELKLRPIAASNPINLDKLDPGIRPFVKTLRLFGIETSQSCQGGEGHSFPEPTIQFHGDCSEGWKALAVALQNGPMPVSDLRRTWHIHDGNCPDGPIWEMVFHRMADFQDAEDYRKIRDLNLCGSAKTDQEA